MRPKAKQSGGKRVETAGKSVLYLETELDDERHNRRLEVVVGAVESLLTLNFQIAVRIQGHVRVWVHV
jgi:hypothetical protein